MPSDLHLLRSNAELVLPTENEPHHQIAVTNPSTGCKLVIAALKPFPNLLAYTPAQAEWKSKKAKPEDYISATHSDRKHCTCAAWSKTADSAFEIWQFIHQLLHNQATDQAAWAFYPDFNRYAETEACAHASLVASLGLGLAVEKIPECYYSLAKEFGAPELARALREEEGDEDDQKMNIDD
ncbi:hypothetical protein F5Y10DRAFT_262707 [Nemania abortiva]|nr:hypothetical protein F5Y10DRAFT_262707 [Nemania abortiva]